VLAKFVMLLNPVSSSVGGSTKGLVNDPFQQVCRASRLYKLLQGKSEAISGSVAIDLGQDCGGRQCTGLNSQCELYTLRIICTDQRLMRSISLITDAHARQKKVVDWRWVFACREFGLKLEKF
jgi:hypothetical protein